MLEAIGDLPKLYPVKEDIKSMGQEQGIHYQNLKLQITLQDGKAIEMWESLNC